MLDLDPPLTIKLKEGKRLLYFLLILTADPLKSAVLTWKMFASSLRPAEILIPLYVPSQSAYADRRLKDAEYLSVLFVISSSRDSEPYLNTLAEKSLDLPPVSYTHLTLPTKA